MRKMFTTLLTLFAFATAGEIMIISNDSLNCNDIKVKNYPTKVLILNNDITFCEFTKEKNCIIRKQYIIQNNELMQYYENRFCK